VEGFPRATTGRPYGVWISAQYNRGGGKPPPYGMLQIIHRIDFVFVGDGLPDVPQITQCTVTNNVGAVIDRPRAHTRVRPYGD